ncbi:MAG: DUF3450 domain-containing protein [Pseudomonadota bacterium]
MFKLPTVVSAGLLTLGIGISVSASDLNTIFGVTDSRAKANKASQAKIDELNEEARDLLAEYKTVMKEVEGLRVYNRQQEKQIADQNKQIAKLDESIDRVESIERQITPLMLKMVEALKQFVELDVPFRMEERRDRIAFLDEVMGRSDVTVAEKFRQVFEAYKLENEFGRTIEAYKDTLEIGGGKREVDILKIGRVALLYQSADGQLTGAWNQEARQWEELGVVYRSQVRDGLQIAKNTKSPDLLMMPIAAPKDAPPAEERKLPELPELPEEEAPAMEGEGEAAAEGEQPAAEATEAAAQEGQE